MVTQLKNSNSDQSKKNLNCDKTPNVKRKNLKTQNVTTPIVTKLKN